MEMAILREMHEGKEIAEISCVPTNSPVVQDRSFDSIFHCGW